MISCSDIDIKQNIDHHYSSKPSRRNEIEFRLTHNFSFSLAAKNSIFGLEQKKDARNWSRQRPELIEPQAFPG